MSTLMKTSPNASLALRKNWLWCRHSATTKLLANSKPKSAALARPRDECASILRGEVTTSKNTHNHNMTESGNKRRGNTRLIHMHSPLLFPRHVAFPDVTHPFHFPIFSSMMDNGTACASPHFLPCHNLDNSFVRPPNAEHSPHILLPRSIASSHCGDCLPTTCWSSFATWPKCAQGAKNVEGRLEMAESGRIQPSHQGRTNHLSSECGNLRSNGVKSRLGAPALGAPNVVWGRGGGEGGRGGQTVDPLPQTAFGAPNKICSPVWGLGVWDGLGVSVFRCLCLGFLGFIRFKDLGSGVLGLGHQSRLPARLNERQTRFGRRRRGQNVDSSLTRNRVGPPSTFF